MPIKKLLLSGVLATSVLPCLANTADDPTPQKHSNCSVQITEPKKSAGVFMSADCKTAYVLPPVQGELSMVSYSPSISAKVCESLEKVEERNFLNEDFRTSIASAIAKKARKYNKFDEMIENGDIPAGTSEEEMLEEMEQMILDLAELKKSSNDDLIDYVGDKGLYAVMEGGRGSFHLTSGYGELINEFAKLNDGKDVRFARFPLKNNVISVVDSVFKGEEGKMEMRAIKRLTMAEHSPNSSEMPIGNNAEAIAHPEIARDVRNIQTSIFGDGIAGALETSAIGDCAAKRALDTDPNADPFRSDITATGKYEYELQVKRKYKVTYNFKELVHIIRESSKRGGFFSRKTVNKLIDTRRTSAWITFHSSSDDTTYEYTDQDIKEIKKQFIDEALRQIVDVRSGGKATALALIDPTGKNGAQQIGDELAKCPNLYCQIGAAGFRILGSIFGSESATSEIMKKIDGERTETDEQRKMTTFVGTSVF